MWWLTVEVDSYSTPPFPRLHHIRHPDMFQGQKVPSRRLIGSQEYLKALYFIVTSGRAAVPNLINIRNRAPMLLPGIIDDGNYYVAERAARFGRPSPIARCVVFDICGIQLGEVWPVQLSVSAAQETILFK